jgi:hypothetical protein
MKKALPVMRIWLYVAIVLLATSCATEKPSNLPAERSSLLVFTENDDIKSNKIEALLYMNSRRLNATLVAPTPACVRLVEKYYNDVLCGEGFYISNLYCCINEKEFGQFCAEFKVKHVWLPNETLRHVGWVVAFYDDGTRTIHSRFGDESPNPIQQSSLYKSADTIHTRREIKKTGGVFKVEAVEPSRRSRSAVKTIISENET